MKWFAFTLTLALGGCTWWQILQLAPEDRDAPPLHMFVLILLAGGWTLYLFDQDRRRSQKRDSGSDDA